MKHNVEGRSTIKKDRHGFWTCKLNEKEDFCLQNPYVYPRLVSQVCFMSEKLNQSWKVVLSHEPWSKRIVGEKAQHVFDACGALVCTEGMVPTRDGRTFHAHSQYDTEDLEVPLRHVGTTAPTAGAEADENAVYEDNQYEEDNYMLN